MQKLPRSLGPVNPAELRVWHISAENLDMLTGGRYYQVFARSADYQGLPSEKRKEVNSP